MSKRIEMNYKSENGSYEVLYPENGNWSKEQILSSDTASNLGIGSDGTPDQAFQSLYNFRDGVMKFIAGWYTGTGRYGTDDNNAVIIDIGEGKVAQILGIIYISQPIAITARVLGNDFKYIDDSKNLQSVGIEWENYRIKITSSQSAKIMFNQSGTRYGWFVLYEEN